MDNNKLSKEMIQNIQHYGEEIKTLKSFVEAVRQNPGYHLGSKGNNGLKNMAREIWQNSFDELDKKASPCTWVKIEFDERTYGFTCEDNGRGIPFGNILRIFTNPNTSSNYEKSDGEYSSGLHGVGAKVTNAMSHRFIIESYKFTGEARRVEFDEGYPWKKGEASIPNPEKKQGTRIYFEPSVDALGEVNVSWREVYGWLLNIFPLCSIGAIVYFTAYDKSGKKYEEKMVNNDGIMTYLIRETTSPLIAPIIIAKDTGKMKVDIAVTWDSSDSATDHIISFANKCPTMFGTHIKGFEAGLTSFFTSYMNKVYLASIKKNKLTVVSNDIKCGLKAIVTVAHLYPIFDGQSKEKFTNTDMEPFVKNTVMEILDVWAKNNPKFLNTLCKYFKDIAEVRTSTDKQRIKLTDKYSKSKLTNLPAKYVAPAKGGKYKEFFITEGDSAAGLIKNSRINQMQGYFPIRGKLPNAFNRSRESFLSNSEVAGIIQIIGGGYGRDFDINKVKWDKIIFCTDADPDGNHIKALLLRFFIMYMPQLIEAGKVYATMPPLYGIKVKNKYIYLRDRMEYIKYVQKDFSKNNTVSIVGQSKPMNPRDLSLMLYNNIDYVRTVNRIAANHAIHPLLLESILTLYYNKASFAKISSSIKKQFRFMTDISKNGNSIVLNGLVDSKYQTVFMNDTLIAESKEILDLIASNQYMAYKVNGTVMSIYEIMMLFEKSAPTNIQRYKGLGEMDGDRLFDSTLDPEKRSLIQYTIDNIKEELNTIKTYENNLSLLLDDVKVSRFDVIE